MQEQSRNTLKDITKRIGWTKVKKLLGGELGVTATGLNPFMERLTQLSEQDESRDVGGMISALWHNLMLSGTRLVKLYRLEEQSLLQIQTSLAMQVQDQSIFCQNYPLPLSREQLLSADTDLHYTETVSSIVNERQIETTIVTAKAYYTEVIELDATHLSDAGLELRANGGEIKCKTREITQCFNTIMVMPSQGVLALTIDLSVLPRAESERQQFIVEQFVRSVTGVNLPIPLDLFALVQEMYEQLDGRVSQVAFLTSDGNVSALKLKPGQNCLRNDSYHHGGETASPILTKYKLGKIWDLVNTPSNPLSVELVLPGKRAMIDKPNSHLYDAIIDRCTTIEQLSFVIDKMLFSLEKIRRQRATNQAA